MQRRSRLGGAVFALLVMWGCSADGVTSPSVASQVILRAQALGSTAALLVEVSGPGIDPTLLFNIAVGPDNVASDTISVPSGGARRFVVTAIDTMGVATHRADTTVALPPGIHPGLALVLRPLTTSLGITMTFGNSYQPRQ